MSETFRSWRMFNEGGVIQGRLVSRPVSELKTDGAVLIRGAYAGVNFKDALTALNRARIMRVFPCDVGIEHVGTVERSQDPRFAPGDAVIVHGFGLAAERDGGFSEWMAVPGDLVVKLPAGLSLLEAGTIGVAGYTAAVSTDALEQNGLTPGAGPVAVNGATGGVATLAIDMLSARGYEVHAITRKPDDGFLRSLGAAQVLPLEAVGSKPLEPGRWAGAIDSLGGPPLDALIRTMNPNGLIAAFGNAAGNDLSTSVLPFILRGVRLIGIYANSPMPLRQRVWNRIGSDLRPRHLDGVRRLIPIQELGKAFETLLAGQGRGRFVVDFRRD